MKSSILSIFSLASLALAAPTVTTPSPFLLVTTSQDSYASDSAALANVSALSLFDPYYQTNYLLRLIEPGYLSLPNFTFVDGILHTTASGPHGIGVYDFNSITVQPATQLQLAPEAQPAGNLELKDGYLLAVEGEAKGWSICNGDLGQSVIVWRGTDASCKDTYIQAAAKAPY